jgi:hypothetical protein
MSTATLFKNDILRIFKKLIDYKPKHVINNYKLIEILSIAALI